MMGYYAAMGWTGWLMMGLMLLFWVGIIALLVAAVRALFPRDQYPPQESALDVLQRRYAKGEITAAEFEQARRALS